jgi:hypothetical protein
VHDKTNTVLVTAELQDDTSWQCQAELELNPGVFEQLAADTRRLGQYT